MLKVSLFLFCLALGLWEQAREWKRLGRMARESKENNRAI
mgnify:CR=1 FL=1